MKVKFTKGTKVFFAEGEECDMSEETYERIKHFRTVTTPGKKREKAEKRTAMEDNPNSGRS